MRGIRLCSQLKNDMQHFLVNANSLFQNRTTSIRWYLKISVRCESYFSYPDVAPIQLQQLALP